MTPRHVSRTGRQQVEAAIEPVEHRRGRQQPRPRGSELDCERQSFKTFAELGDGVVHRAGQ